MLATLQIAAQAAWCLAGPIVLAAVVVRLGRALQRQESRP